MRTDRNGRLVKERWELVRALLLFGLWSEVRNKTVDSNSKKHAHMFFHARVEVTT